MGKVIKPMLSAASRLSHTNKHYTQNSRTTNGKRTETYLPLKASDLIKLIEVLQTAGTKMLFN